MEENLRAIDELTKKGVLFVPSTGRAYMEKPGLGLAVSNACDSLKAVADEIICSNEELAIVYVMNHYFE